MIQISIIFDWFGFLFGWFFFCSFSHVGIFFYFFVVVVAEGTQLNVFKKKMILIRMMNLNENSFAIHFTAGHIYFYVEADR